MSPEQFLQSFVNLERTGEFAYGRTLDRMRDLLSRLNHPERALPRIITVAGSKGKGTTAMMIERLLRSHGFSTGLYLSPHIERWNERIQTNGVQVSDEVVNALIEKHRTVFSSKTSTGEIPTYFEIVTALAFLVFANQKPDVVILEVGLGGKYDATNICDADIAVITPLSLEHTKILGNSLVEIAGEKAGIIKNNSRVVTSKQPSEALSVIQKTAAPHGVDVVSKRWTGDFGMYGDQYRENAALAVRAAQMHMEAVKRPWNNRKAEEALQKFSAPGRMQILAKDPLVIVDGAHNGESARRLVEALREFRFKRVFLICGMMRDKQFDDFLASFKALPLAGAYAVPLPSQRSCEPEVLAAIMKETFKIPVEAKKDASEVMEEVMKRVAKDDLILATGSLYLTSVIARKKV